MYALTGTTGHLGQCLLRQAAVSDIPVRSVVRGSSDRSLLAGLCDEVVEAALDDTEALTRAFAGCDVVVHAAAMIDVRRGRKQAMQKVNVDGTVNVLEACRAAGVKRLVYVSSIEAIDMHQPARPITETHGFAVGNAVMEYGETKAEASLLVAEAGRGAETGDLQTVLICPTGIMGPWDFREGLLTTMFRRYTSGRIPASIPGGFDYVDVREVAGAVLAAASGKGRSGEAYLTAGDYLDARRMMRMIDSITGQKHFLMKLPLPLARVAGTVSELWSLMTGREALFTKGSIDILQVDARIEKSKAEAELGYVARPIEETMRETLDWLLKGLDPDPSPAGTAPGRKSAAG